MIVDILQFFLLKIINNITFDTIEIFNKNCFKNWSNLFYLTE